MTDGSTPPHLAYLAQAALEHPEVFASLFDEAAVGVLVVDRDLRYLGVNEALARMNGLPASDHLGRTVDEVLGAAAPLVVPDLEQVLATGVAIPDRLVEVPGPGNSRAVSMVANYYPLTEQGRIVGVAACVVDISPQRAFDLSRAEARRELDDLVADMPVGVGLLDRDFRFVRVNPRLLEINGAPESAHLGVSALDANPHEPVRAGMRTAMRERVPVLDVDICTGPPICDPPRHFRVSFLPLTLAGGEPGVALTLLERTNEVRLMERERAARAETERLRERAQRLQGLATALSAGISRDDVARAVIDHGLPLLGAHLGGLFVTDERRGGLLLAAAAGGDDLRTPWRRVEITRDTPPGRAVLDRRPEFLPTAGAIRDAYPHLEPTRAEAGDQAWLTAPLIADGRVVGVLGGSFAEPQSFGEEQRTLVEAVATRVAVAVDRARLYERERDIARALQASLVPQSLPESPRLEMAVRYLPAGDGIDVGGDFYDVHASGRDRWHLVVGDVRGKGPDAARLTGLCRHTLRTCALLDPDMGPAEAAQVLNRALVDHGGPDDLQLVTALIAHVTIADDAADVRLTAAGHPAPLVIRGQDRVEPVAAHSPILGFSPELVGTETRIELGHGDTLLCFTDGITDARVGTTTFGEHGVAAVAEAHADRTPDELVDALIDAARTHGRGRLPDDVVVLALRPLAQR